MTDYLLDSGILMRHLRNYKGYPELTDRLAGEAIVFISVMTRFEIVRGMRIYERESTFNLLDSLDSIEMTNEIADMAGEIYYSGRARGVTFGEADAIIAATAMQHGLALVTTNAKPLSKHNMIVYEADSTGKVPLRE